MSFSELMVGSEDIRSNCHALARELAASHRHVGVSFLVSLVVLAKDFHRHLGLGTAHV